MKNYYITESQLLRLTSNIIGEQSVIGAPNYGTVSNSKPNPKMIKVSDKHMIDYIPNFKTKRWDGVEISSHGYIQEIADKIKKYPCFS